MAIRYATDRRLHVLMYALVLFSSLFVIILFIIPCFEQVMARHRRLSPACPFVSNPSSSGNVPLCGAPRDGPANSFPSPTSQSRSSGSSARSSTAHIGMWEQTTMFRSEAARLETFTNWPVSHIVTPEQLAKVGFYYQGTGDKVHADSNVCSINLLSSVIFPFVMLLSFIYRSSVLSALVLWDFGRQVMIQKKNIADIFHHALFCTIFLWVTYL